MAVSTMTSDCKDSGAAKPALAIKRHPEFYFDNTLIVIQIEDTLFNVHKYQLMKSETFSDMFSIAEESGDDLEEGSSPENPIVMLEVAVSDFEALLKVLYATRFSTNQFEPEAPLIIPAFRLANKWNFKELRDYLIPLAEKVLDDVDKIAFAREFDVKDWLAPALTRLCQRKEPLTSEESSKLGVDSLLLVSRIREEKLTPTKPLVCPSGCGEQLTCTKCENHPESSISSLPDDQIEPKVKAWIENGCVFAT